MDQYDEYVQCGPYGVCNSDSSPEKWNLRDEFGRVHELDVGGGEEYDNRVVVVREVEKDEAARDEGETAAAFLGHFLPSIFLLE